LLIVPELSALGGTEVPGHGLDIRGSTEVLVRLLEKETGGRPVTVAGISLGGWMAVRLALERPDLVSRLVLINAGGYRDQDWDNIQSLVTVDDLSGVDRLYGAMFAETPWVWRMSREGFLQAYTSKAVKNVLASLSEEDTFDAADLARIRVPVGLIWAEKDGLFRVEVARAMARALPDAHLQVLPDCGHAIHLEHPNRLFEALERFRREAPAPAEGRTEGAAVSRKGALPADAV
jgi:pimeloyl-ACP methyl ester carboxylesterase